MYLNNITQDELRILCRKNVETLEIRLKRIFNEEFSKKYGNNYFHFKKENGDSLIKNSIIKQIENNFLKDKEKFNNKIINATTLENLIDIICNPEHYKLFTNYFRFSHKLGREETKNFLEIIKNIRNKLDHSNPISVREGEKVICYTNDIIESFKYYYTEINMEKEYNVPEFVKFIDSFGNEEILNERGFDGSFYLNFKDKKLDIRPGDEISIEVFIDSSFEYGRDYEIEWSYPGKRFNGNIFGNKIVLKITEEMVGNSFSISCQSIQKKKWHKHRYYDDMISFSYKILPPLD